MTGQKLLVFGASGYIGRHLVNRLRAEGHDVRAAARRLSALEAEGWEGVELVAADALAPESLAAALDGVSAAYYLVHSMAAGAGFEARDRTAAENFAQAAARAGVRRIVYLGGLAPARVDTPHLASRVETGTILRRGTVPVTELRAGIVVGPGSAAFEVMRDLVAHLPVMVTPRWVRTLSPPIALDELLDDLVALPRIDAAAGGIYEAAGPDRLSYEQMMHVVARALGRRRLVILPVPLLSPKLSSYWLALVTATPVSVARALITGLKHDLAADDRALRALVPHPRIGFEEAVRRVFADEQGISATDRWREGAFDLRGRRHDVSFYGKSIVRGATSRAGPEAVWRVISEIGTLRTGYFSHGALWRLRLRLDALAGGRQAGPRADGSPLGPGVRFDVWRVLAAVPGRRLTLVSDLVAPGKGGMEFEIEPLPDGGARLAITAHWHPAGAPGLLYWLGIGGAQTMVLRGMAREICRRAERLRGPA